MTILTIFMSEYNITYRIKGCKRIKDVDQKLLIETFVVDFKLNRNDLV